MNGIIQMIMRRLGTTKLMIILSKSNAFNLSSITTEYDDEADLELTWIGDAYENGYYENIVLTTDYNSVAKNNLEYYLDLPYGRYMATLKARHSRSNIKQILETHSVLTTRSSQRMITLMTTASFQLMMTFMS